MNANCIAQSDKWLDRFMWVINLNGIDVKTQWRIPRPIHQVVAFFRFILWQNVCATFQWNRNEANVQLKIWSDLVNSENAVYWIFFLSASIECKSMNENAETMLRVNEWKWIMQFE